MRLVLLVVIFLLMGAFFIVSNNNLHLSVPEERSVFFNSYYAWFFDLFSNFKGLAGYVISSDWVPDTNHSIK